MVTVDADSIDDREIILGSRLKKLDVYSFSIIYVLMLISAKMLRNLIEQKTSLSFSIYLSIFVFHSGKASNFSDIYLFSLVLFFVFSFYLAIFFHSFTLLISASNCLLRVTIKTIGVHQLPTHNRTAQLLYNILSKAIEHSYACVYWMTLFVVRMNVNNNKLVNLSGEELSKPTETNNTNPCVPAT